MSSEYDMDVPTYPDFGKIYKGDYFTEIPYKQYIKQVLLSDMEGPVFNIQDFGASPLKSVDEINNGSEVRVYTAAIQKALDSCVNEGGGTVLISGGMYVAGTIYVGSNTTLYIEKGSALIASRDLSQFNRGFVIANGAKNVTITGGGVIHGQGEWFVYEPKKTPLLEPLTVSRLPRRDAEDINGVEGTMRYHYRQRIRYADDKYQEGLPDIPRPDYMVWIRNCSNVKMENIILRDAMAWTLNLDTSDSINIRNLVVDNNRHVANTDGIDITGSRHVQISHCFIATADDGIVLKNPDHTGRDMFDIQVSRCRVQSVMNAFKIGTETKYDIYDVEVSDCLFELPDIYPGMVSGISIESADGSKISNIRVHDIRMEKVTCPFFIALNMRNRYDITYQDRDSRPYGGAIEGVSLHDLSARDVEVPCLITGFIKDGQRQSVKNIEIKGMKFLYRNNSEVVDIPDTIDEYLYTYPENNNFGDVDAFGIWVRHADNITMKEIDIKPRTANTRDCIKLYDTQGFSNIC